MKANYDKWKLRLIGQKVPTFTEPNENDVGFYRLPLVERAVNAQGHNNGRWKVIGYKPVALFVINDEITGSELVAQIGDQHATHDRLNDQWQWFVKHPISEDLYRAVAERGEPWPDEVQAVRDLNTKLGPIENEYIFDGDNKPPAEPLDVQHATAVDNAIAAAIKTVTNENDAAQALGSKNRIAELRLLADKAGKAKYEPIYREYTAEQKKWSPIIARATATEKSLNTMVLTFREKERQRIAKEQAEADRKQREIDEANARAADRAIASGEPEAAPVIEEVAAPVAPAPILPTYGTRKLKEEVKKFVVIDDIVAVLTRFKTDISVVELVTKLAQKEIDAGRNVPGTHTREGLI